MRTPRLRVLAIAVVFLATAAATAGLLWSLGNPVSAGVTPGMSLSAAPSADPGEIFTLSIGASPPPNVGVAGYATEVIFPTGLKWMQRPDCTDEVVGTHSGGSPVAVCIRAAGPHGEVRHAAATGVVPPLPALDTPLTTLLEIDVRCNAPGSHKVSLTAWPASAFGAAYFGTDNLPISVTTVSQDVDVDGDTAADYTEVADGLVVECSGPTLTPTPCPQEGCPTATHTPTPTATPGTGIIPFPIPHTPTPTPCPPEGCPTDTPMPTRTHTPTATPCPPEGCPTATTTVTPTRTATNTPTPTPCPPEGCPTSTQTPTLTGTPPHTPTHSPTATPMPPGDAPGMSLSAPPSVDTGEIFTLSISASPPPNVGVAGYATEVILPTGLKWMQRPDCVDELVTTHSGGSPVAVCLRFPGPHREVRHVASGGLLPPLPALDTPLTTLLEIDVRCNAPGSHKVALTAAPASAFGAIYFGTDADVIGVTTVPQDVDVDGDTVADYTEVADGLVVECTGPTLTPTPTSTPTGTATSTATPTPCPASGCPTPTITPTVVLLPDSDSPSPTPTTPPKSTASPPPPRTPTATASASPTATLISEIGDPLFISPATPTPTDVSRVLGIVGTPGATETALSQALQLPGAGGDGSGGSGPPRVALIAALLGMGGALMALAGYRRAWVSRQARL